MDRREMLKASILSGAAVVLAVSRDTTVEADPFPTGGNFSPSPPTRPFLVPLPRMPIKAALPGGANDLALAANGGVAPNGTVYPQVGGNDALTTFPHSLERIVAAQQLNSGGNIQFPPQRFYLLDVRQSKHVFHPDYPYSTGSIIWGYDGIYPGPTFISRYGVPLLVRIVNSLFDDPAANGYTPGMPTPGNFGDPRISTHLHNGHTGSESDGNPADIYPPIDPTPPHPPYPDSIRAIRFRDHHYAMFRAGLDRSRPATLPAPNVNDGDTAETVSTLWYHDHSMDHTAENVYKGLVGFHLFFDEIDSGDENDPSACALRLPSGNYDVPLLFQDKRFDSDGQLFLDALGSNNDGFLGDRFVVNGVIQPKFTVARRKYRLRLLNAGPSRFYQFFLTKNDVDQQFQIIANDESLLEAPLDDTSVVLGVAERADIVIDFSKFQDQDHIFLVNRLVMRDDGRGPTGAVLPAGQGDQILRFDVAGAAADPSRVPAELRKYPQLPSDLPDPLTADALKALPNHTRFVFDLASGLWVINDNIFEATDPPGVLAGQGAEGMVWTLKNADSTWSHPIHIHAEEFRILLRNNMPPPPNERGKKDVIRLGPDEEVQIFVRFRDVLGKYPIHCHNVVHEDHSMMMRFDVIWGG